MLSESLKALIVVNRHFQKVLRSERAPIAALEANEGYINDALDELRARAQFASPRG